ncbi:MAG TPA: thiamine pyrophosphate-binding protein [Virgibacillus sp.]|nr:thiamine pyrophosphate-binding protein [Virgibacillus sp.]
MNNQTYTVSEAIVKELRRADVDVIYGIVSVHNMPIYNAILNNGHIRMVTARNEGAAVNMADAYARATGKIGVVMTSTGTGAGNAAGSLAETWNAGTPLLHITGEVDSDYIGTDERYIHEAKDQLKMMDGASKSAYLLKRPKSITPFMRKAINEAQAIPTGPVTIQIPTNFQATIIPENQLIETEVGYDSKQDVQLPDAIINNITTAKRPVIWAGNGINHAEASEELLSLMEKIQAPVITSGSGKGVIPEDHPLCIGNFGYSPEFEAFLKTSDLLISIGVRFRAGETNTWATPVPENHIHINADPNAFNRNFNTRYHIVGDAKKILEKINQTLNTEDISRDVTYINEVKETRQALRDNLNASIGQYKDIAASVNKQIQDNTILLTDVTIPGYIWADKLVDIKEPRNFMHITGEGIGQGLPMAIGAKIGQPDKPVVLVTGDGGFMVNAGELITAVQEDTPIIVLLFDDGGYGILKYYQEAAYGQKAGVDLKNPDFVMMAKSMGFESEKVTSAETFDKVLANAIKSQKPYMVVVDMQSVGDLEYEDSDAYIRSFRPHHG